MDVLFQNYKLMVLLAWHGFKMAVLYSIHYRMRINDHTGMLHLCNVSFLLAENIVSPIPPTFGRVLCSKLESDDMENITVFIESDSSFCVDITSTKDGKFITVNSNSRTSSEEGILLLHLVFPFRWSVSLNILFL